MAPMSFPANSGIAGLPRVNITKLYSYAFVNGAYKLTQAQPVDAKPALIQALG
jgi:hypothetical protein